MTIQDPSQTLDSPPQPHRRWTRYLGRAAIAVFAVVMVVFWTWALFFADPEPVNRIGDEVWTSAAQTRCETARTELESLANYQVLEAGNTDQIRARADILDQANRILNSMVDDLEATPANNDKGRAVLPEWFAEYRIYLSDREAWVDYLRETGENASFEESVTEAGLPISERLETFAGDNDMPACAPPTDTR